MREEKGNLQNFAALKKRARTDNKKRGGSRGICGIEEEFPRKQRAGIRVKLRWRGEGKGRDRKRVIAGSKDGDCIEDETGVCDGIRISLQ